MCLVCACMYICMYVASKLPFCMYLNKHMQHTYVQCWVVSDCYVYLLTTCFLTFYCDPYSLFQIQIQISSSFTYSLYVTYCNMAVRYSRYLIFIL